MTISLIVAVADNNAIGIENKLPWAHIKEDMMWFKEHTKDKTVVMGSSTWDSLPKKPLPNRTNIVLSSRDIQGADLVLNGTAQEIVDQLTKTHNEIVIMGGAKVYNDFAPLVSRMYITRVHQNVEADTYLDIDAMLAILGGFACDSRIHNPDIGVSFEIWSKT
jgi:dihydrofolate reductase